MGRMNNVAAAVALALAVGWGVTGCGGGGSSGTVSGLALPSSMSVVSSKGDSSPAYVASAGRVTPSALTATTFPADSDYATDPANKYVYDSSMESLQTVNMILCLMDQTRASDMVNDGAYFALVNEDKCEQGNNQSSAGSTGQSSGTVTQLNKWTIESSRASDSDPMIVHIWIPGDANPTDPMDAQNIMVELTATEGVSDTQPFGVFGMNFKGVLPDNVTQTMSGSLSADGLEFEFYNDGGNEDMGFSFVEAAHVIFDDASGESGQARTSREETGFDAVTENYALAFDTGHVLRTDTETSTDSCLAREDFTTHVWRYNLYYRDAGDGHVAGQRVELNSGFPFTYTSGDDTLNGFVGYWGVWAEDGDELPDGTTITRQDFGGGTATDYTVHVSGGKLIRREAQTLPLSKLVGQALYYWGENPDSHEFGQWLVAVGVDDSFTITASVEFEDSGPVTTALDTPVDITPSFDGQNLWLWADSLGGNVVYIYDSAAADPSVTFYGETFVQPDDATLFADGSSITVYCYDRCLKGGLTQGNIDAMAGDSDLYYPTDTDPSDGVTSYAYTLAAVDGKLVLTDTTSGQPVDATALDMSAIGHEWGVQSGELVLDTTGITNPWDVYSQPVTYRWESGPNSWNRLTTVSDADDHYASFDRPLRFNYTVDAGDDMNGDTHVGDTFVVQYGGPGNLWGFPWVEDEANGRWYSEVNLNDGVELTDSDSGAVLVVRPVEMEQTMNDTALADCGVLDSSAAQSMSLPGAAAGSVSFDWSDRPTPASEAPAVIEGELQ